MSETIDAIEDRVVPSRIIQRRRTAVTSWVGGVKERVMGTTQSATGQAGNAAHKLGDGVSSATDAMSNAPAQVQSATRGSPLIAGAIAFGIGALIAAVLPETEAERKAVESVQPQVAAATDAVKDAGQHAMEAAKSSGQEAMRDLKDSASTHAQEVAGEMKDAGQHVKETADARGSA